MADKKQPPKWIPGKGKVEFPAEAQPSKPVAEVPPSAQSQAVSQPPERQPVPDQSTATPEEKPATKTEAAPAAPGKKAPPKWAPGKGKIAAEETPAPEKPVTEKPAPTAKPEVPETAALKPPPKTEAAPAPKPAPSQPTFKAPPAPSEQKEEFVPKRVAPQVVIKKTEEVTGVNRRTFLSWVVLGWLSFTTATVAGLTAFLRFLFPKVLFEPPTFFKVGFPGDYGVGKVDTRWTSKYGVWIGRTEEGIYALIAVCTHLGCTPNWLETENKFKCPCHGSGFYMDGINFEGPAPRPLERAYVALADDGQILIDKKKKFFYEKGEWNLPGAILKI